MTTEQKIYRQLLEQTHLSEQAQLFAYANARIENEDVQPGFTAEQIRQAKRNAVDAVMQFRSLATTQ